MGPPEVRRSKNEEGGRKKWRIYPDLSNFFVQTSEFSIQAGVFRQPAN
jgi:hypothetical protein